MEGHLGVGSGYLRCRCCVTSSSSAMAGTLSLCQSAAAAKSTGEMSRFAAYAQARFSWRW